MDDTRGCGIGGFGKDNTLIWIIIIIVVLCLLCPGILGGFGGCRD